MRTTNSLFDNLFSDIFYEPHIWRLGSLIMVNTLGRVGKEIQC